MLAEKTIKEHWKKREAGENEWQFDHSFENLVMSDLNADVRSALATANIPLRGSNNERNRRSFHSKFEIILNESTDHVPGKIREAANGQKNVGSHESNN